MKNLWVLAIVAALAIGFGCGEQKDDATNGDENGGSAAVSGGPEATAKAMLDGFKKGDRQAFLDGLDLKGIYEMMVPEEDRAEMSYDEFAAEYAERAEVSAHNALYDRPAVLEVAGDVAGLQLLDLGCGPGLYAEQLAKRGATVYGIE